MSLLVLCIGGPTMSLIRNTVFVFLILHVW